MNATEKSYDSRPNVSTLVHFLHQGWSKAATRIIFSLDLPISVNSYWGAMAAQKLGKTSLMRINGQLVSVCKKTNGFRSSLIKTLGSSFERLGGGIAIFGFAVSAIFLFLGRISVLTPVACCFCSISLLVPGFRQEFLDLLFDAIWCFSGFSSNTCSSMSSTTCTFSLILLTVFSFQL